MNSRIKTSLISIFVFVFASCSVNLPVATSTPQNNKTYEVDYLFEHEGCKVYRFRDNGNYVYFTNCVGDVTSLKNDSTRTRVVNKVNIQPAK